MWAEIALIRLWPGCAEPRIHSPGSPATRAYVFRGRRSCRAASFWSRVPRGSTSRLGLQYALGIRSVFKGPCADGRWRRRIDGSWRLEYCQEGHGDDARALFTNRGLVRCAEDRVPIGVFVQQAPDSSRIHVPYEVAGLALVRDWVGEKFVLDEYCG